MKPLRIAVFNWRDPWDPLAGGAERVTLKHAEHWAKLGWKITWISGSYRGAKRQETINGVRFFRFGPSKLFILYAWFVYWVQFGGNFDLVIDEVHGLPALSPLWAWKSKKIVFIHELAQEIWQEMLPFPISSLGPHLERFIFKLIYSSTRFWVDCKSTLEDLATIGVSKNHIEIIPCAIDPPPKPPTNKEKTLTCIFLARLVRMKGIEYALEAFSKVVTKEPKARLWIVGTGDKGYLKLLKALVKELNLTSKVIFLGAVSEHKKFELLSKAHFLLHTSIREGFGLTILEANSQKTPAMVFKVAALKDIVKSGKTGYVIQFSDTSRLATKVLRLWREKSLYRKMSTNAYNYSQQFAWPKFVKQSSDLVLKEMKL